MLSRSITAPQPVSPGTVSKILWHFTGGPGWNPSTGRQNSAPKSASEAYRNLVSILRTKELRLGSYKEIFRVRVPGKRSFDRRAGQWTQGAESIEQVGSAPVCCLSDIPAAHLGYHASRYGKFAIGFHRDAAVTHGFNPVLYSLENTAVVRSVHVGFSALQTAAPHELNFAMDEVGDGLRTLRQRDHSDEAHELSIDLDMAIDRVREEIDTMQAAVQGAHEALSRFLAFIKTFDETEFGTVYCEREWRALQPFSFDPKDVAMIVLPRTVNRVQYFERFIMRMVRSLRLVRSIPIVPWEDLVEH